MLWYAYNTPYGASANTGFEVEDALLLYFVVDTAGDAFLVVTADKPQDVGGGTLELLVDSPDLAGGTAGVAFYDDTRATTTSPPERGAWPGPPPHRPRPSCAATPRRSGCPCRGDRGPRLSGGILLEHIP